MNSLTPIQFTWLGLVFLALLGRPNASAGLQLVATNGTPLGGATITRIRPGVSVNNAGTIAFAAALSDGRTTVLAVPAGGQIREAVPGGNGALDYGVQINDSNNVVFVTGPGISYGTCIPDPLNPGQCLSGLDSSLIVYSVLYGHALQPTALPQYYSIAHYYNPWQIYPVTGPFTSLRTGASLNNNGRVAFVGDISTTSAQTDYRLGTAYRGSLGAIVPCEATTRPLLADNGRIALRDGPAANAPVVVWDNYLSSSTVLAQSSDFAWIVQYPGITDSGNHVAFSGKYTGNTNILPQGEGLFLSSFSNGQWHTRLVLGTNYAGTNILGGFQSYYRTCVAELAGCPGVVKICFVARAPAGRVGVYTVVHDTVTGQTDLPSVVFEMGRDLLGMGNPIGFELYDAVNGQGDVAFQAETAQRTAVVRHSPLILETLDFQTQAPTNEVRPSRLRIPNGNVSYERYHLQVRLIGPPGEWVRLFVVPLDGSGGHAHSDTPRKHGWLLLSRQEIGNMPGNGPPTAGGTTDYSEYETGLRVQIGANGQTNFYYTAPEIAGAEDILAMQEPSSPPPRCQVRAQARVLVRIPGLIELPQASAIAPEGERCAHPNNHFGSPDLIQAVLALATNHFVETAARLPVNDMSLPKGGMFDIGTVQGCDSDAGKSSYGPFWDYGDPPKQNHFGHRAGDEVDIGLRVASSIYEDFPARICRQGWWHQDPVLWASEVSHFHLQLSGERGRVLIEPLWVARDSWNPGTREMGLTLAVRNCGGLAASAASVVQFETYPSMPHTLPILPLDLGSVPIQGVRSVPVRVLVPIGVDSFYLMLLVDATVAERPGTVYRRFSAFGEKPLIPVAVPGSSPSPPRRSPKDGNGWELVLARPVQEAVVGTNLIFEGSIRNFTGSGLFFTNVSMYLQTPAAAESYVLDYAETFLNAGGYVPPSGYSGPVLSLRWLALPPVGSANVGVLRLATGASVTKPKVEATFASPYLLQTLHVRSLPGSVVVSWPDSGTNMQLHSARHPLDSEWLGIDQATMVDGGKMHITLPATNSIEFFRLFGR